MRTAGRRLAPFAQPTSFFTDLLRDHLNPLSRVATEFLLWDLSSSPGHRSRPRNLSALREP
jgi:hypothetical protein